MHLHDGAVQRNRLDSDAHDLSMLQLLEHPIQYTHLGPAVHPGIDRVPVAESLGHSAPLAAMLGYIQDRVQHLQVGQADVASLAGQTVLDLLVLLSRDLHPRIVVET